MNTDNTKGGGSTVAAVAPRGDKYEIMRGQAKMLNVGRWTLDAGRSTFDG